MRSVTRWEPFREMEDMLRRFAPFWATEKPTGEVTWAPTADISETEQEYLVKAHLPDVKREDVKVTVGDGVLTLSGERRQQKESKDENDIRVESFYGSFSRSFRLPDNCDPQAISAEMKDGVLKVHIPKTKQSAPQLRTIQVN